MKIRFTISTRNQNGSSLMLVLIVSAIALATLAGIMTWATNSNKLTHRSINYTRATEAAEAATEKVVSQITQDFLNGGDQLVSGNLNYYRQNLLPAATNSAYWTTWQFNDGNGNLNQTYVQRLPGTNYVVLDSTYAGLKGYVSTYIVASHAQDSADFQGVMGGVYQQLQLAGIPIFQFGMYSSDDMEISCGQPFDITGRVHCNGTLYVEPDSSLTFESSVTAVSGILTNREPIDPRGIYANGTVLYVQPTEVLTPVQALTLPIGATNTPTAIREIIEPPPAGEDATSPMGRLRYYNQCDMVIWAADSGVIVSSGKFNNFATAIPTNEWHLFVVTNNSFWDARESKTVMPIDIDVGAFAIWSQTNSYLHSPAIAGPMVSSIYVDDTRTLAGNQLNAVRVFDGSQLPNNGLTIATGRPLYIWKDYNTSRLPASFASDAISILSDAWTDPNSTAGVGGRNAASTTVNAALLTGVVETTSAHYSGGMENFPRFLETWASGSFTATFTYNGSMIKMFPSLYATNAWNNNTNIYVPPARNWAYDTNYDDPTKLPPKTPQLLKVIRGQWATVPPGTNAPTAF